MKISVREEQREQALQNDGHERIVDKREWPIEIGTQSDWPTHKHTQTDRQTDVHTNRQKNRQTDTQTHTHAQTIKQTDRHTRNHATYASGGSKFFLSCIFNNPVTIVTIALICVFLDNFLLIVVTGFFSSEFWPRDFINALIRSLEDEVKIRREKWALLGKRETFENVFDECISGRRESIS